MRGFDRFGTHHSKFAFMIFPNFLRVAIHTANYLTEDWEYKIDGVFVRELEKALLQEQIEESSFRPVSSSMIVLPKRFHSDAHQVAETLIAVVCGCSNTVRFYAESTTINHRRPMTKLVTGSTSVLDLGEYMPAVSCISLSVTSFGSDNISSSSTISKTSLYFIIDCSSQLPISSK